MRGAIGEFPIWIRAMHWINVLFLGFLVRTGIQILGADPRLYWNDHSIPGTEWLKFTRRTLEPSGNWTSIEQEIYVIPWLAQPALRAGDSDLVLSAQIVYDEEVSRCR
jgi:hypothetical protein